MKRLVIGSLGLALLLTAGNTAQASFQTTPVPANIRTAAIKPSEYLWKHFFEILTGRRQALGENQVVVSVRNAKTQEPLANTTVLLGAKNGDPFEGNQALTNDQGIAVFTNAWLRDGKPFSLTAFKDGFSTVSVIAAQANQAEIDLEPHLRGDEFAFVEGKVYGWPTGYDKSTLEVGMFLPGISPVSLLNFDPQQIVSSYKVEMDVYGKRMVPGNVVMPLQKKRYLLFPITLEKETFIMPLPKGTAAHMSSVIGTVPISDAISLMKEKDFLGLLNITNLTHLNWTERMTVDSNRRFDINASRAIQQKLLTAKYTNIPPQLDVVAIATTDPTGDQGNLVAMDVKSLKSEDIRNGQGALSLGGLADAVPSSYIFSAAFDRNQFTPKNREQVMTRALTGRLQKALDKQISVDKMLQIIKPGTVSADRRDYTFSTPNSPKNGVNADFLILSIYADTPNEVTQGKLRKIIWTAILPGDSTSARLPDTGQPVIPSSSVLGLNDAAQFYWEVVAVKSGSAAQWNSEFDLMSTLNGLEYVSSMAQKF